VIRAILVIFSPRRTSFMIACTWSGLTLTYRPALLPPTSGGWQSRGNGLEHRWWGPVSIDGARAYRSLDMRLVLCLVFWRQTGPQLAKWGEAGQKA
jgi:hypothetical protein